MRQFINLAFGMYFVEQNLHVVYPDVFAEVAKIFLNVPNVIEWHINEYLPYETYIACLNNYKA